MEDSDSVPGKLQNETDTERESKEKENVCGPCGEEGKAECAEGFCVDCQDYLCENCFKYHCIPKPTKHHKVLDKNDMPKRKVERDLSDVCLKHRGEIIKHYCKDHGVIGCYSCIYPEHNSCAETCLLEDVADGTESSSMYKEFFNSVSELKIEFETQFKKAQQNGTDITDCYFKAQANIKASLKSVTDHFGRLANSAINEATKLYNEDTRKADQIEQKSRSAIEELNNLKEDLQLLEDTKQSKQLFMVVNHAKQQHYLFEKKIKSLKSENHARRYRYISNPELDILIKGIKEIGILPIEKRF